MANKEILLVADVFANEKEIDKEIKQERKDGVPMPADVPYVGMDIDGGKSSAQSPTMTAIMPEEPAPTKKPSVKKEDIVSRLTKVI